MDGVLGGWQVSAINTAQAGTPFNLTYSPNSAQLASTQITANYRGVNLYRPNRVAGVPLTQGRSVQIAGTGDIQYINYNAVALPAIDNASGAVQPPFGNMSRNPGRTPALYQTDLDFNKTLQHAQRRHEDRVPFRALQHLQSHESLPAVYDLRHAGCERPSTGGGLITSTFTPRVIQFALKVIY